MDKNKRNTLEIVELNKQKKINEISYKKKTRGEVRTINRKYKLSVTENETE